MGDLVRVGIVESEPAAEVAVGLLRVEGIRAIWRSTSLGSAGVGLGSVGGISGAFEVLVLPEDAERAGELLNAPEPDPDSG
jgi:hypothetical protein